MKLMILLFFCVLLSAHAMQVERVVLSPAENMQRADLYVLKTDWTPTAILILCPGVNGSGEGMVRQPEWQEFARFHQFGLIGLSFASDISYIHKKGYYYASQGSGQLLIDGIRQVYGQDLPLLLFGFSGGAHFTSRFEEWKPDRVVAWCAYSAGWWDEPKAATANPPGIIACGDQDLRYGASLIYFKQGRSLNKPWLWITIPHTGHSISPEVESFVRNYFDCVLKAQNDNSSNQYGAWIDIDQGTQVEIAAEPSSVTGWLPDVALIDSWRKICMP